MCTSKLIISRQNWNAHILARAPERKVIAPARSPASRRERSRAPDDVTTPILLLALLNFCGADLRVICGATAPARWPNELIPQVGDPEKCTLSDQM
jgi:hypothetical protein